MKKHISIICVILVAVLLSAALTACGGGQDNGGSETPTEPVIPGGEVGGGLRTAAIIFDFSFGSPEENFRQETESGYEDFTPDDFVRALGSFSGLEFIAEVSYKDDGSINVDWARDSSLILGYPPEDQDTRLGYASEEHTADFRFFDADSLRWFMMDSMYATLAANLNINDIYYTMDGGKELVFDELYPINVFPSDIPYMGSAFYFAHDDVRGDDGILVDNSQTGIGVMYQEYEGGDIAEILMITYDGQQEVLEEYGWKNPEIEMLNNEIETGPASIYRDYLNGSLETYADSIEIRSYPFADDEFVQIITTCVVFPEVIPGLYTKLWSYNFSKTENRILTVEDILDEYGLTRGDIEAAFSEVYIPEHDDQSVVSVEVTGFLINRVSARPTTHFLLEVMLEVESDPYKSFFMYTPDNDEIGWLDFNPDWYDMVRMSPPLAFEREMDDE